MSEKRKPCRIERESIVRSGKRRFPGKEDEKGENIMSAVLGPIHYWLYEKIQWQEELLSAIKKEAEQAGWLEASGETVLEAEEEKPLEELIDPGNIHGWLQERIQDSETRYAKLAGELLKEEPDRIRKLEEIAFAFGKKHALSREATAEEAYRRFENCLLNGMPCDRVNRLVKQEEECIVWEETKDLHQEYWIREEADPQIYRRLRQQIMAGILWETGYQVSGDGKTYEIRKQGT